MKKIPNIRWYLLALIFLATIINYLDRQTIAVMAPEIAKIYKLDDTTMALIFSAFLWAYTIGPSIAGWIMDRLGSRRGYVLSMGIWSAAGVLTAFALHIGHAVDKVIPLAIAPIVTGFIICRFILGLGESANWPAAIKTISEWFPVKERSFAVGWFNSGSSVGALIAPGLCTWLLLKYGWQMGFIVVGIIGFIWMFGWLAFYRPLAEHPQVTDEERDYILSSQAEEHTPEQTNKVKWLDILKIQPTRGVIFTRFFMDPIWWFYTLWLPTALAKDRHMDLKGIAIFATLSFLASDLGNLFGGWASSNLIKRGYSVNRARKTVMTGCAIGMLLGLGVPFAPMFVQVKIPLLNTVFNFPAAVSLVAVVMFCYQSWSVNMLTIPADVLPRHIVASSAGLSHMGAGLGGIVMNYAVGHIAKSSGGFTTPFLIMGTMPLVGILFLYLVIGRIAPYKKLEA